MKTRFLLRAGNQAGAVYVQQRCGGYVAISIDILKDYMDTVYRMTLNEEYTVTSSHTAKEIIVRDTAPICWLADGYLEPL